MSASVPRGYLARLRALLATRRASVVARSAGYLLIFAGFLTVLQGEAIAGLWLVLIGWLLTRAARANYNAARVASLLDGLRATDALDAEPAGVAPTLSLETLVEEDARQTGGSGVYPVRQAGDVLGVIDVLDADDVPRAEWGTTRVDQVMRPVVALDAVAPDQPLFDVVARFERSRREAFAVIDPAEPGRLIGLVTRERVHALMRSRAARGGRGRGLAGR